MGYVLLLFSFVSTGIAGEVNQKKLVDVKLYGKPVYALGVKTSGVLNKQIWLTLINEDFESGTIPSDWVVIDGNGDGTTWQIYTTGSWHTDAMPGDSGSYIVGYDDDAAGSNPATEEELILPAVYSPNYDSMKLIYSFGYQNLSGYDTLAVRLRTFDGSSWSTWNNLVFYYTDLGSGNWDTLDLSSYLPAESVQVEFNWWDHRSSHWDWYVGLDNIQLLGHLSGGGAHDAAIVSLPSPPQYFAYTTYDVSALVKNTGDSTFTFGVHAEITDTLGSSEFFTKDTTVYDLLPDSSLLVVFGQHTFSLVEGMYYNYTVYVTTLDSNSLNDTLSKRLRVDFDVRADSVISPTPIVKKDNSYPVIVRFSADSADVNTWTFGTDFHANIFSGSTVFQKDTSRQVSPGSVFDMDFGNWTPANYGIFTLTSYCYNPYDYDFHNDTITTTILCTNWQLYFDSLPYRSMDHAVVYDGSNLFLIGGYDGSNSRSDLYIYSFAKGTWTAGASMPLDLCMYDAAVLGDTIYVPGGYSYSVGSIVDTLFKYSISGNNWTSGPGTGDPAWFYACFAVNGKIYRIGGYNNSTSTALNSTWEYDPQTGTWTKKSDIPYNVELMGRWLRNDTIFIAGGYDGNSPINTSAFYVVSGDTWIQDSSQFANLPYTLWGGASGIYKDTLYLFTGVDTSGYSINRTLYYDDASNTWVEEGMLPYDAYRGDGLAITGQGNFDGLYFFGGSIGGFNPIDTISTTAEASTGITTTENLFTPEVSIGKTIRFTINSKSPATVEIYDITGRTVRKYDNVKPGTYEISSIPQGVYFVRVKTKERTDRFKVTILR